MQPTYIPWLGYFDLIDQADIFVFLDNVQLVKRSWQVRNKIKTAKGILCLTIPVKKTKSRDETILCETYITPGTLWKKKHLKSIQLSYKKTPYFDKIYSCIEKMINKKEKTLSKFNINIIKNISRKIGIKKKFINTSKLKNIKGRKDTLLVNICKAIDCNSYLSPLGAAAYIERQSPGGEFAKNKINLYYQNYKHPTYNQIYEDFLSHMSVIDLLFNHGFDQALEIIRKGRRKSINYRSFSKKFSEPKYTQKNKK
jgi:hypothetical protein